MQDYTNSGTNQIMNKYLVILKRYKITFDVVFMTLTLTRLEGATTITLSISGLPNDE